MTRSPIPSWSIIPGRLIEAMPFQTDNQEAVDTLLTASTPEGLQFALRLAGPYPRALAFAFDTLIQGGIIVGFAILINILLGSAVWLFLLIIFLVQWFYF